MMSNKFNISVIIPIYNMDVELFNRAINSIKFNCEIIVVNDGSDNKYNYVYPGAKFINLEHNVGHLHARRIGVENATGDWIIFLDADDELSNNAQEVINEINTSGYRYNMLFTEGDHSAKDGTRCEYVNSTSNDIMIYDLVNSKNYIDPFVTGVIWRRKFLTDVLRSFEDYPNVRLGEDHLIMIKALSSKNAINECTEKKFYIRHEPTTCKKLSTDASIEMKISVFESMQVFRDSLMRLMNELDLTQIIKSFKDLAFRLSTCRIPITQDFIDYLSKNGYNTEGLKPVKKVKYLNPNKLNIYFRYETTYCSNCIQFDGDGNCRYGSVSDMVSACINHKCRYRESDTEECDIHDYFKVSKDTDLISVSDEINDGDYICSTCKYWDQDSYCCSMDEDPIDACINASCEEFNDRYGGSNDHFDKLKLDQDLSPSLISPRSNCIKCRYNNCGAPFCASDPQTCSMYEPW